MLHEHSSVTAKSPNWGVFSTVLATKAKYRSIWASLKGIKAMPPDPGAVINEETFYMNILETKVLNE